MAEASNIVKEQKKNPYAAAQNATLALPESTFTVNQPVKPSTGTSTIPNGTGETSSKSPEIITDPSRMLEGIKNPQDHHIIPAFRGKSKPYADFIKNLGIDVNQYTVTVSGGKGGMHMNVIHGKGKWNQKWMEFIDNNSNATAKDIYQFAGLMMDEYGLSGLNIHPYGR